ncbi:MAG: hypothetical protein HN377_00140 [Alphaproteobacteria bacterium]|jgi:hypothetical protein|nr:hypothetical protein [Alphaproteobacteria bacterium]
MDKKLAELIGRYTLLYGGVNLEYLGSQERAIRLLEKAIRTGEKIPEPPADRQV